MSDRIQKGSRRPTSSADKRKAAVSFKKFDRSAAGQKYKKIMADPQRKLMYLRNTTLPKYQEWLKSATEKAKTATGEQKSVLMRKIKAHKERIKLAKENIQKAKEALKAANKPVKPNKVVKAANKSAKAPAKTTTRKAAK